MDVQIVLLQSLCSQQASSCYPYRHIHSYLMDNHASGRLWSGGHPTNIDWDARFHSDACSSEYGEHIMIYNAFYWLVAGT